MSEQEMKLLVVGDRLWISRSKWVILKAVQRGFVVAQLIDGKMEHKSLLEWHQCEEAIKNMSDTPRTDALILSHIDSDARQDFLVNHLDSIGYIFIVSIITVATLIVVFNLEDNKTEL